MTELKFIDTVVASKKEPVSSSSGKVVYLGHIPHGFYEKEMTAYFTQFGKIRNLRLSRNKKTGHSKHYAFIEFESTDVAKVVRETMNGYMLCESNLTCSIVADKDIHPRMWKGANKIFKPVDTSKIHRLRVNAVAAELTEDQIRTKRKERNEEMMDKIASALGKEDPFAEKTEAVPATPAKKRRTKADRLRSAEKKVRRQSPRLSRMRE